MALHCFELPAGSECDHRSGNDSSLRGSEWHREGCRKPRDCAISLCVALQQCDQDPHSLDHICRFHKFENRCGHAKPGLKGAPTMTRIKRLPANTKESGQTIVMVALCIVAMLAMAALGIDLATLYTARAEAQRTADAAALAGAQAFVDTGLTSFRSTDLNFTNVQTAAQAIATAQVAQIVQANKIAGAPGTGTPSFPPTNPDGNPQITVTVQRTGLPTFFARVLGPHLTSVSATARAEAFNPSFSS